jgi:hypothetical protein
MAGEPWFRSEAHMQQVKIFKGLESDTDALEEAVNAWLSESGVRVLQIFGNIAPQSAVAEGKTAGVLAGGSKYACSDLLIVVLYES